MAKYEKGVRDNFSAWRGRKELSWNKFLRPLKLEVSMDVQVNLVSDWAVYLMRRLDAIGKASSNAR